MIPDDVPAERVDLFMRLARESHTMEDLALIDHMVGEGTTPWEAAKRAAITFNRSPHSMYVRARTMAKEIHEFFGPTVDELLEQLLSTGRLDDVPGYLIGTLRQRAWNAGALVEEVTSLRVSSRLE